jgi:hypothetical protein
MVGCAYICLQVREEERESERECAALYSVCGREGSGWWRESGSLAAQRRGTSLSLPTRTRKRVWIDRLGVHVSGEVRVEGNRRAAPAAFASTRGFVERYVQHRRRKLLVPAPTARDE